MRSANAYGDSAKQLGKFQANGLAERIDTNCRLKEINWKQAARMLHMQLIVSFLLHGGRRPATSGLAERCGRTLEPA